MERDSGERGAGDFGRAPVYRTALEVGGNTNFAGTFPIWDILFGTFRMPPEELPENYGKDEAAMPSEIVGQLAYPFRR